VCVRGRQRVSWPGGKDERAATGLGKGHSFPAAGLWPSTWLDARRSANAYWEKWLAAASLRPDLQRLAMQSLPPEERPKARRSKNTKSAQ
jgi:hypothetical protein